MTFGLPKLGISRHQKSSIRYQYQWISTILDTKFDTTVKKTKQQQ